MSELHQKSVIHRDIKYKNIVINSETREPELIDFGICHAQDEYISKEPVINKIAVDQATYLHNKGVDSSTWLDVFLLSQLMIKMLSINNEKQKQDVLNIARDWRFINYPEEISEINILKIRALTARSSLYESEYRLDDCKKMKEYIEIVFPEVCKESNITDITIYSLDEIKELTLKKELESKIYYCQKLSEFESLLNLIYPIYIKLSDSLKEFLNNISNDKSILIESNINNPILDIKSFQENINGLGSSPEAQSNINFIRITINSVVLQVSWRIKLSKQQVDMPKSFVEVPHILLNINSDSNNLLYHYRIFLNKKPDCITVFCDQKDELVEFKSVNDVNDFIKKVILSKENW